MDNLIQRLSERRLAELMGSFRAVVINGPRQAGKMRWMREQLGDRFAAGIIIHLGDISTSFGDRIQVLPLVALWGHAPLGK